MRAYARAGDVKAAVDACVALSRWDQAVALAERHDLPQIQGLLSKYAAHLTETRRHADAVDLFQRAGKHLESANALRGLAAEAARVKSRVARAKKLHVLAALELDAHRRATARGARDHSRVTNDLSALDGLTALDETGVRLEKQNETGAHLDDAWRDAEAFHFWALAQKQLYENRFEYARRTASVLAEHFEDILDPAELYSLLALASYHSRHYGTCSRAFARLEALSSPSASAYADLATEIFTRHPPRDPGGRAGVESGREDGFEPFAVPGPSGHTASAPRNVCVASGRRIGAADAARACATCGRRSIEAELRGRGTCPLCHARLASDALAAVSDEEEKNRERTTVL